jgi:poly(beta-D-mannuronate) lyase
MRRLFTQSMVAILSLLIGYADRAEADVLSEEVVVHSLGDLARKVADAAPGDVIELADGDYVGDDCVLAAKGSAETPIIVRAAQLGGARVISPIKIASDFLVLEGIRFEEGGGLIVDGIGCKILRCVMNDVQTGKWIRVLAGSKGIEIAYCRFENKTNNRERDRGCQLLQVRVRNDREKHHIHHNHFLDVPVGKSNNGYETLQLITEKNPFDPAPGVCGTVIETNLFERCSGEAEIISVKANENVLRNNTFRASAGSLVLRHGHGNVVSGNFFFGDGEPRAGGVRMQGKDQVVVNNLFRSLRSFGVGMMDGTPDDLYIRTERALVAFNTMIGCSPGLRVGINHSKHPNGTAPKDCVIANNVFVLRDPEVEGTRSEVQTVELVQGDEPEGWSWEGNLTDGLLGMPERDGIGGGEPELVWLENGVVLPEANGSLAGTAKGSYDLVDVDAAGRPRGNAKAIGCLEPGGFDEDAGPLRAEDVGPEASVK